MKQGYNASEMKAKVQAIINELERERNKLQTFLNLSLKQEIKWQSMLQEWPRAPNADHYSSNREGCTLGTRTDILNRLKSWVSDSTVSCPPIFWICGMAGTGKSTIAKSICEYYSDKNRDCKLGASFFCSRQLPELRAQMNVIPTIAYGMSIKFSAFKDAFTSVDQEEFKNINRHVVNLLVDPWKKIAQINSVKWLVVLDALDELEGEGGYHILQQLIEKVPGMHGLKILVTSRPDHDIVKVCKEPLSKTICHLEDVEESMALQDITTFINTKLAHLLPNWKAELNQLAEQCGGLFIYAATAVRYISGNPKSKVPMKNQKQAGQLKSLLRKPDIMLTKDSYIGILYQKILDEVLNTEGGDDARTLVSTIVCSREPLSVPILAKLSVKIGEEPDEMWVNNVVNALHAMTYIKDGAIYIYHKSFLDFFPKNWTAGQNIMLAENCMHIIQCGLHFNMCDIVSSFQLDFEVPNLQSKVQEKLGNELGYATQYWISHLVEQEASNSLLDSLVGLMESKILFWIEAMNLLQKKEDCYRNVRALQIWLNKAGTSLLNKKTLFIEAAATVDRLVKSFTQTTASLSTPHLYLSSLATEFATTPRATQWKNNFRNVPKVICTGVSNHGGEILQMQYGGPVRTVAFSPDGLKFVSGSNDGSVCIWDALTGEQLLQMEGHTDWVRSVAFSSNGSKVISGSHDRNVSLWNAETGEQEMIMNGHTDWVYSVAFSPDGRKVVSGSKDKTVHIWDVVTGNTIIEMAGHTDAVYSVAFSPDGVNIVSGSADETIGIWNASTGAELKLINGHSSEVWSVVFSLDGIRLVSGSADHSVCIWDAVTGDNLMKISGHISEVTSVAFTSDGSLVVSGSNDKTVRIWDAVTGEQLKQLDGHTDWINSVVLSPDGSKIMSGSDDETIRIWDAIIGDQPKSVDGHTGTVWSVAFSSDGSKVVSGSADRTICIWDALTGGKLKQMYGHTDEINSVCISSDGSRVVSGSDDKTVCIWDTVTGRQLKQMCGHSGRVWSVTFSLNGAKIVSGSADKSIRIWNAGTGEELKQVNGHTEGVRSVAFSSDESKIVSGSYDKTIRIWDAISGEQLKQMDGHTSYVLSVTFSFDGAMVVSGSSDHTVCIWDVELGERLQQIKGYADSVWAVAFSSDGSKIVSGSNDKTVCIWDAAAGEQLKVMVGHTDWVCSVAFSPDGSKIVSGSGDQTIRIWNAASGQQHKGETSHIDHILSTAPSSDHATNILSETQNEYGDRVHAQRDFGLPLISPSSPMNSSYAHWNANNRGWIQPYHSFEHRLMWLPPSLSYTVVTPNCLCIISHRGHTSVQFDWDCIGENWGKCYTPTTGSSD
ncbi:hypothetical protein GYMLUDRAFT_985714 [Collybiopsis luxurians FD-317 M1]|uniref:NACHT domain-containing protein n=1 Tax=Collybiopsis luxurians FD-317 M1 TaxID=944289 RepID=A0A0D0BMB7_9AGAR|nr:hypothetical protein GYMLUDRAFT_985714 [Collybiopsis luxurians FD-317 M1]